MKFDTKDQKIMDFIAGYIAKNGFAPTVREIGNAVGLSSSSSVHARLLKLAEMGYIKVKRDSPRAMQIIKADI